MCASALSVDLTLQVQPDSLWERFDCEQDAAGNPSMAQLSGQQWQEYFERWLTYLNPPLLSGKVCEISLVLTTDAEIQRLNATYRQQDNPTDVLAFAAQETDLPQWCNEVEMPLVLGDIVISVETAVQQAAQQGHALSTELAWLSCHGLLHLLGWDHPTAAHLTDMLHQQAELLKQINLVPPVWFITELGYLE
jgi:probable rRNA maturation factor